MSAVKQEQSALKLTFFNNCFEDDFSRGQYIIIEVLYTNTTIVTCKEYSHIIIT